ncbi:MAG: hypothetical protein JSR83_23910 [Proteobacteria bacterium]|nr:hypothetical protein [Pseudomonadota bacterium]
MEFRTIIACKLRAKNLAGTGLISAIADEVNGSLIPINENNFCQTLQAFVIGRYEEIDSKFRYGEYFKIRVELMAQAAQQEPSSGQCIYKTSGNFAEKLQPSEYLDLLEAELPSRNDKSLSVRMLPATTYVMVKDAKGDCFGPMEWTDKSSNAGDPVIELKFITGGGLGRAGRTKQINRTTYDNISHYVTQVNTPAGPKMILGDVVRVATASGFEEYASDSEIIEFVKGLAGDSGGKLIDRKSWATMASMASASRHGNSPMSRRRLEMFTEIVNSSTATLDQMNTVFESVLKSEMGSKVIEAYIEQHRARFIGKLKSEAESEHADEMRKRQEEIALLREEIEARKKESVALGDEIETKRQTLREGIENDQQAYLKTVSEKIQAQINEGNAEIEANNVRLAEIRKSLNQMEGLINIQKETDRLKVLQEYFKEEAVNARRDHANIQEELVRDQNELRKKLLQMRPYVDSINGAFGSEEIELPAVNTPCHPIETKDTILAQRAIVDAIKMRLNALGRQFTNNDVANLLISTQQSFVTFLAGLPGVGKTSLCTLFSEAQGLRSRLHTVPVARGWTSIRDIVGFHNPLSDQFQSASTGLYEYLNAICSEEGSGQRAMSYVLLDEANLSSIEHYWSVFMGMADTPKDRKINLGKKVLHLPESLRFLATINYDGTTEPLSQRVLDRATVIVMQPHDITDSQEIDLSTLQSLPISADTMHALFGVFATVPEFEPHEKAAMDSILSAMQNTSGEFGRQIPLSQRKIQAVRQYCARAGALMRSSGNEFTAFDWAMMQHIFPQIRGTGSKFGARLLEIKKVCDANGLEMSGEYLDRMIFAGQNELHSYDFFCW